MAVDSILHSGSFADYDGNEIKVTFYKWVDLNAVPDSISFGVVTASKLVKVWSRTGTAVIDDSEVDWLTVRYIRGTPMPGSNEYIYTYSIMVQANDSGAPRRTSLTVYIEDGEGAGTTTMQIPVYQNG